jgi:hypothetical protein
MRKKLLETMVGKTLLNFWIHSADAESQEEERAGLLLLTEGTFP